MIPEYSEVVIDVEKHVPRQITGSIKWFKPLTEKDFE